MPNQTEGKQIAVVVPSEKIVTKYRTRLEIIVEILRSGLKPGTKTRIMHRSSLTHPQIIEYFSLLLKKGLLESARGNRLYRTTPRGVFIIRVYEEMETILALSRRVI